jgi:hypothetical protein
MDLKAYLDQGEIWIVAPRPGATSGPTLKIADMELDHRRKAARWLMDRSQALITIIECQTNEGLVSGDEGDSLRDVLSLVAQNPRFWLRNTTLFKALISDLPTKQVTDI